jgi:hypothetical protein
VRYDERLTPPATRAPESGPMMKDMVMMNSEVVRVDFQIVREQRAGAVRFWRQNASVFTRT